MKVGSSAVDRAGGVAEHAVDAHAELLVVVQLLGRLEVLAVDHRTASSSRMIHGLTRGSFSMKSLDVDDQVADHREVGQRLDPDRARRVVGEERARRSAAARR